MLIFIAVTHETIIPVEKHVREENITREIHNHDVYHFIQPVVDVEVRPAKHYLQNEEGELIELPPDDIPPESDVVHTMITREGTQKPHHTANLASSSARAASRKYPKVGKFARRDPSDSYERPEPRNYRRPSPTAEEASLLYGTSPSKPNLLNPDERSRGAKGAPGLLERGRERTRRPPSLRSTATSKSSLRSVVSKASSMHVREHSEH